MRSPPFNVLFVCTVNQARPLFAAAALNDVAGDRFRAFAASVKPARATHSLAVATLRRWGHDVASPRPLHPDAFRAEGSPRLDFVFSLCDLAHEDWRAAWPSPLLTANWTVPDPAKATGSPVERALAFDAAYETLRARIEVLSTLPTDRLDRVARHLRSQPIGSAPPFGRRPPIHVS